MLLLMVLIKLLIILIITRIMFLIMQMVILMMAAMIKKHLSQCLAHWKEGSTYYFVAMMNSSHVARQQLESSFG